MRLRPLILLALMASLAASGSALGALRVVVKPGDTLGGIAARHGVNVASLAGANGIANAGFVRAGRVLVVPATRSASRARGGHRVRSGENLSRIAARYGTTPRAIARLNGLANPHRVIAGTNLQIPRASTGLSASSKSSSVTGGYVVRPGDNLGSIAARYGTTAQAIARANRIANPNVVVAGTRLRIPGAGGGSGTSGPGGGGGHVVQPGDNLGSIAARYGTTARAIARANGIRNPNVVIAGTRLRIPGGTTSATRIPVTAATSGWGTHPSRGEIAGLMARHAATHGVSLALVRAVAWQESGWWQGARSSTGAIGVMQLMPGTAAWLGPALLGRSIDPYGASDNIEGGVAYLAYLERRTGSTRGALAAYYQGIGSVEARGLLPETEVYVASVLSAVGRA